MAGLTDRQQSLIVGISIILIVAGIMVYATYHNSDPVTIWASVGPIVSGIVGLISKELGGTATGDQISNMAQQIIDGVGKSLNAQQAATGQGPVVNTVADQDVGTFQGWPIKIVNSVLSIYPPAAMAKVLGPVMSLGSVAGWPQNTDWISVASPAILAATQAYQNAISQKPPVVIPPA